MISDPNPAVAALTIVLAAAGLALVYVIGAVVCMVVDHLLSRRR